jgi:hypothetical protein
MVKLLVQVVEQQDLLVVLDFLELVVKVPMV